MTVAPLADPDLLGPFVRQEIVAEPNLVRTVTADESGRLAASRGIVTAVLLSTPFWVVIGLSLYFIL